MTNQPLRIILSDIRSTYNVGAILRTADACRVELVYACGYTPYPALPGDERPAHVAAANTRAIAKTALGAESTVPLKSCPDTLSALTEARRAGFSITVIEQAEGSLNLFEFEPHTPLALVFGNELDGVSPAVQALADQVLELPMLGTKESLAVSVAAGIALYQLRFGHTGS